MSFDSRNQPLRKRDFQAGSGIGITASGDKVVITSTGGAPAGGTTGQVLAKASGTDGDVEWVDASGGSGIPTF